MISDRVTAYHEAGHAVVSWRLRVPLRRAGVTMVPDGDAAGSSSHRKIVGQEIEWDGSDRIVRKAERLAQICFAGGIAQRRYSPQSVRKHHAESDRHEAVGVMIHLAEGKELEAWLKLLYIRTENMLANPDVWRAVQRLAEHLLKKRPFAERKQQKSCGLGSSIGYILLSEATAGLPCSGNPAGRSTIPRRLLWLKARSKVSPQLKWARTESLTSLTRSAVELRHL